MAYSVRALAVDPVAELFAVLGDPARLRIVALLSHGELCVVHLEEALGLAQSNASRHLSLLRAAGVVAHRRKQRWVYYQLAEPEDAACRRHLDALKRSFAASPSLRHDVQRLRKSFGPRG